MTKTINRAVCVILIVLTIAISLISCDNGENRVSPLTGEIGADAMCDFSGTVWKDEGKQSHQFEGIMYYSKNKVEQNTTYEEFIDTLAKGNRLSGFSFKLKSVKELENKSVSKASFVLEADRTVTLIIVARYSDIGNYCKTVTLEANKPQNVEFIFTDYKIKKVDAPFFFNFSQLEDISKTYDWGTDELSEWSQTIYKITDFKIFCD